MVEPVCMRSLYIYYVVDMSRRLRSLLSILFGAKIGAPRHSSKDCPLRGSALFHDCRMHKDSWGEISRAAIARAPGSLSSRVIHSVVFVCFVYSCR